MADESFFLAARFLGSRPSTSLHEFFKCPQKNGNLQTVSNVHWTECTQQNGSFEAISAVPGTGLSQQKTCLLLEKICTVLWTVLNNYSWHNSTEFNKQPFVGYVSEGRPDISSGHTDVIFRLLAIVRGDVHALVPLSSVFH